MFWCFGQHNECGEKYYRQCDKYFRNERIFQIGASHKRKQNASGQSQHHQRSQTTTYSGKMMNCDDFFLFLAAHFDFTFVSPAISYFRHEQWNAYVHAAWFQIKINIRNNESIQKKKIVYLQSNQPICGQCIGARPMYHSECTAKTTENIIIYEQKPDYKFVTVARGRGDNTHFNHSEINLNYGPFHCRRHLTISSSDDLPNHLFMNKIKSGISHVKNDNAFFRILLSRPHPTAALHCSNGVRFRAFANLMKSIE